MARDSAVKYYTPSIEEFHVGFEFQTLDIYPTEWKDDIISKFYPLQEVCKWIEKGEVRVKILDKDDFLELGFEELAMPEGMEGDNYFKLTENGYMYSIWKEEDRYVITMSSDTDEMTEGILFFGKIRNKSELSKILNQVKWNL